MGQSVCGTELFCLEALKRDGLFLCLSVGSKIFILTTLSVMSTWQCLKAVNAYEGFILKNSDIIPHWSE